MTSDSIPEPSSSDPAWLRPSAFIVAVAALIGAIGIGMAFVGSQTTGISGDEPTHVRRLNHYLADGLYVRAPDLRLAKPGTIPEAAYVYGPVTALAMHDANRLLGKEPADKAKTRPVQYAVRHVIVAGLSVLGLLATAAIATLLLGARRWGVVAAGILAAIPVWTGSAMFNVKDIPVATGMTGATLALILLALSTPATKSRVLAWAGVLLAASTVLMIGTRPGIWAGLAAALVVFAVIVVRARAHLTSLHVRRLIAAVGSALLVAYAVLLAVYPRVFSHPLTMLILSATGSADFQREGDIPHSTRGYVFGHLLTDLPLGILTFAAIGTVVAVVLLAVQRRRSTRLDCLALVGSQAFTLMAAAVVLNSNLYHGLRQLLFAIPAIAILATVGLAALLTGTKSGRLRLALGLAACAALVLPTAVQAAMFPYQYAYINVAAEQAGVHPDEDYWGTSFREFVKDSPTDVKITCPFQRYGYLVWRPDFDCRTRFAMTFSTYWRGRPTPDHPKTNEFYALLRGTRPMPLNCTPYREVTRWRNLERVLISRMVKCYPPTPAQKQRGWELLNRDLKSHGFKPIPPYTSGPPTP